MAIDGHPLSAIDLAVRRLIRGEFDDVDRRFLPTPAQLSNAVAYCCKVLERPAPRKALPAPGNEVLTEDEIARRCEIAARVKAQFGVPGVKREPVPTPAEEFDAWEKREKERLATEGLPKLSPAIVEDTKRKLADAQRIAEALMAAEEAAEARRQKLASSMSPPTTPISKGEAA